MAMKVKSLPSRSQNKQYLAQGGTAQGPSHEQGGIEAQTPEGKPVAEIEGGERLFSQEDTQQIEQACQQITQLQQENPKAADQLAKELGYAVCEMVIKQEQQQQSEDQGQGNEAANSFSTAPDSDQGE